MAQIYDTSPARRHIVITPHDTDPVPTCRALYVGGGNVAIIDKDGVEAIYVDVTGVLPIMPTIVKASGTTATNIIGLI